MATSLEGFFNHFNNESGNLVTTLNPYNTCEITFDFYPSISSGGRTSIIPSKVAEAGIPESQYGMLNPMRLDLTYYIQSVAIPNFVTLNAGQSETWYIGRFPLNGNAVVPESTELSFDVLNTRGPILERVFYPWLKEVTLPFWSYDTQPYTTATIIIDLTKHTDLKYVFIGSRPKFIQSFQPSTDGGAGMTRQLKFDFDFMFLVTADGMSANYGYETTDNALPHVLFGMKQQVPVNLQ